KYLEFDLRMLGRGLHDNLSVTRGVERYRRLESRQQITPVRRRDHAFRRLFLGVLLDRRKPALHRIFGDVDQHRLPSMLGKHVRDPVAHRAGAYDGGLAHPASHVRGCFQRAPITASVPAMRTIVETMPPSGPNGPPSTHAWRPGVYSTAGTSKV